MGGAEVGQEPVRTDLQAGAGRLVLLSPGNIFHFSHFSHGTMITLQTTDYTETVCVLCRQEALVSHILYYLPPVSQDAAWVPR